MKREGAAQAEGSRQKRASRVCDALSGTGAERGHAGTRRSCWDPGLSTCKQGQPAEVQGMTASDGISGTSLVVQWSRIPLPKQGTRV